MLLLPEWTGCCSWMLCGRSIRCCQLTRSKQCSGPGAVTAQVLQGCFWSWRLSPTACTFGCLQYQPPWLAPPHGPLARHVDSSGPRRALPHLSDFSPVSHLETHHSGSDWFHQDPPQIQRYTRYPDKAPAAIFTSGPAPLCIARLRIPYTHT